MEKYPLRGNSKSIALNTLVGSNKNTVGSGSSGTGFKYQSVSKKVTFTMSTIL